MGSRGVAGSCGQREHRAYMPVPREEIGARGSAGSHRTEGGDGVAWS